MNVRAVVALCSVMFLSVVVFPAPVPVSSQNSLMSSVDGIEVPEDILIAVQMEYPGQAVTSVSKSGNTYRLTVDKDDVRYNGDVIILTFDAQWKLVGTEQRSASAPAPSRRDVKQDDSADEEDGERAEKPKPRDEDKKDDKKERKEEREALDEAEVVPPAEAEVAPIAGPGVSQDD